jgi:FlaG/FlaF family flagellin (archaellin)
MRENHKNREHEDAVSPVVGVMLMLVVTIIIAAVVSGFAGGLFGGSSNQKTPTLAMDVKISNSSAGTTFSATVLSVSEPIPSKNLQLTTSWIKGTSYGGGNSSTTIPYGFGPGVSGTPSMTAPTPNQNFGNYTLAQGTGLIVDNTNIETLLGANSHNLAEGDSVTLRLIYTPTGKMVWQKDLVITGGA